MLACQSLKREKGEAMAKRQGIMQAKKLTPRLLRSLRGPVIVQPKINGNRVRAKQDPGCSYELFSSSGALIETLPHIVRQLNTIGEKFPQVQFDGEAYSPNLSLQEICSRVRRKSIHLDYRSISYYIFDVINESMQISRSLLLQKIKESFPNIPNITFVESYTITKDHIQEYLSFFLEQGFEGIIIREVQGLYEFKRSNYLLKLKLRSTMVCQIIGFKEAVSIHGEPKGMLGSLNVIDKNDTTFSVGAGNLVEEQRKMWWQKRNLLLSLSCQAKVSFRGKTDSGRPTECFLISILPPSSKGGDDI